MTALRTEALDVGHSGVAVVKGLDIEVDAGEIVAVLGRNGAGKTTTLRTIAGLLNPVAGRVLLDGRPARDAFHRRARQGLGFVTEERAVIRRLSVQENLRLGSGPAEVAYELFPELRDIKHRRAGLLSGGEQQMLALGRSLAAGPKLLLVDELSFGLAPLIVRRLLTALDQAAQRGAAVVLVEQHPAVAFRVATRGYVIAQGAVAMSGPVAELRVRLADIRASYLTSAAAPVLPLPGEEPV